MAKSKQELLQYAIKMRQRGDTYYYIKQYLERNASDPQTVNDVIALLSELEKVAKPLQKKTSRRVPTLNIVLGIGFVVGGIVLFFMLWEKGFVAVLPFLLVIIGITALASSR
jgi:uncharacterized membrane protein